MSISPGSVHVALAQYTPKGKLEFNLDSAQSNEEAASRLEVIFNVLIYRCFVTGRLICTM